MTKSILSYFSKIPSPNTITLGIRALTFEFWGAQFSSQQDLSIAKLKTGEGQKAVWTQMYIYMRLDGKAYSSKVWKEEGWEIIKICEVLLAESIAWCSLFPMWIKKILFYFAHYHKEVALSVCLFNHILLLLNE